MQEYNNTYKIILLKENHILTLPDLHNLKSTVNGR